MINLPPLLPLPDSITNDVTTKDATIYPSIKQETNVTFVQVKNEPLENISHSVQPLTKEKEEPMDDSDDSEPFQACEVTIKIKEEPSEILGM